MKHLVSTDWLEKNLENVRIFDASWHLPSSNRNALEEFQASHLKNSSFFDIDKNSNQKSNLPHMLPTKDYWEKIMSELGVKNSDHVIVYDNSDTISSCRVWYTFLYVLVYLLGGVYFYFSDIDSRIVQTIRRPNS